LTRKIVSPRSTTGFSRDGETRWAQYIIDVAGLVRQVEICHGRIAADANELARFVRGSANDVIEERNQFEEEK